MRVRPSTSSDFTVHHAHGHVGGTVGLSRPARPFHRSAGPAGLAAEQSADLILVGAVEDRASPSSRPRWWSFSMYSTPTVVFWRSLTGRRRCVGLVQHGARPLRLLDLVFDHLVEHFVPMPRAREAQPRCVSRT